MGDGRFPAAPYLDELIDGLVFDETWGREQLSARIAAWLLLQSPGQLSDRPVTRASESGPG